jgi:hypothetical protein
MTTDERDIMLPPLEIDANNLKARREKMDEIEKRMDASVEKNCAGKTHEEIMQMLHDPNHRVHDESMRFAEEIFHAMFG